MADLPDVLPWGAILRLRAGLGLTLLFLIGCGPAGPPEVPDRSPAGLELRTIRVGDLELRVEVADTAETLRQGLMFRSSLAEGEGMLFVYPSERTLSFWMRNTRLPLDIAFIANNGTIVDVQSMEPYDETPHLSRAPARYALEVPQGWFTRHRVGTGDRVQLD